MSALISAVTPNGIALSAVPPIDTALANTPPVGSSVEVISGQKYAITDPTASLSNEATTFIAPTEGNFELGAAVGKANIVVTGSGAATVEIGSCVDAAGNFLDGSGSTFQVDDGYAGKVIVDLSDSMLSKQKVDKAIDTGSGTISENAPAGSGEFDYYVNTGSGDDQVEGSTGDDFLRLGAGDDSFDAGGGDDLVRLGSGNDTGALGAGDDKVYLTVDQLQGTQTKTITDFDSSGDDKIQLDSSLEGRVEITGQGTNTITITLSGTETGTTTFVSEGGTIDIDDIEFV